MAFKLGIIGLGKIAQDQHLPVVAKNKDFELAAVVSSRGGYGDVPPFKTPARTVSQRPEARCRVALHAARAALRHRARCARCGPSRADGKAADADGGRTRCASPRHAEQTRAASSSPPGTRNTTRRWTRRSGCFRARRVTRLHVSWKEDVRHWHPGQEWIWEPGGFGVFDPGINAFSIVTKILPQPIFVEVRHAGDAAQQGNADCGADHLQAVMGRHGRTHRRPRLAADRRAELEHRRRDGGWPEAAAAQGRHRTLCGRQADASAAPSEEYEGIYVHFAELLKSGTFACRRRAAAARLRLLHAGPADAKRKRSSDAGERLVRRSGGIDAVPVEAAEVIGELLFDDTRRGIGGIAAARGDA